MKKRWEVFWLAEAGIILIYILLCLAAGRVLIAAGAAAAAVSVWWSLYYFTAHYTLSNNVVEITSGIILRRHRSIPLSNILWEMRLTSPFFEGRQCPYCTQAAETRWCSAIFQRGRVSKLKTFQLKL